MKGIRSIIYVIFAMIILIVFCEIYNVASHIIEKNDQKELREVEKKWKEKRENEIEAIKKYIKVVSNLDIDSMLTDENVYNAYMEKLRQDIIKDSKEPGYTRSLKYIVTNRKK